MKIYLKFREDGTFESASKIIKEGYIEKDFKMLPENLKFEDDEVVKTALDNLLDLLEEKKVITTADRDKIK